MILFAIASIQILHWKIKSQNSLITTALNFLKRRYIMFICIIIHKFMSELNHQIVYLYLPFSALVKHSNS